MINSALCKLRNGVYIPTTAFGTCKLGETSDVIQKVVLAAQCGYRHFDTAAAYENEAGVGKALKIITKEYCNRSELFITDKISNDDLSGLKDGYSATKKAFYKSLELLQIDYLDLYLIHWPVPRYAEDFWRQLNISTWRAMEDLYKEGKIKAIGVSNFTEKHIDNILQNSEIAPMVNQIEVQPFYQQRDLIRYCLNNDIFVEAWGPLKQGEVFSIDILQTLAQKYNKTVSQICLKFCLQLGAAPIVKCSSKEKMLENTIQYDWELSTEDMDLLSTLNNPLGRYNNFAYSRRDNSL